MFWHRQAAASFDAQGQLTEPLRVNCGGDHDRVAELLAGLPEPFSVTYQCIQNAADSAE